MSVEAKRRRERRETLLAHPAIRDYLLRRFGSLRSGKHALGDVPLRSFDLPKKIWPK